MKNNLFINYQILLFISYWVIFKLEKNGFKIVYVYIKMLAEAGTNG